MSGEGNYRICYYDHLLSRYVVVATEHDYYDGVIRTVAKAKQIGCKFYLFDEQGNCVYSAEI